MKGNANWKETSATAMLKIFVVMKIWSIWMHQFKRKGLEIKEWRKFLII